ncbi:MAG TPA: SH3 domain-containing protein [bacterium]|nr:SH3 domain-containing protein [Myxococcales bacterium]OQA59419.1 MAG: hypothetical protein BWY40_01154 [bacterium ADurb.Bin270]HPW44867.1 SH3 domain-containing protein [bacterium]HQG14039.1 SH3 domain-containing protein [bacterium]HQH79866.1 SH3 domain-containing protein [bacterium]
MKRLFFAVIFVVSAIAATQLFAQQKMTVEVREVMVKTSPNYLAQSSGKLSYGTEVNVIGEEGSWIRISSPSGYLPKSSVTKKSIPKNPDQKYAGGSVKHDEVALAGKGFNPQVEAQYKKNNAQMAVAFSSVDKIEKLGSSEAELRAFQSAGKLKPR